MQPMSPRSAALIAVLGVLLVALLVVVALLVGRASTGGAAPTSAATSPGQASPTPVATPAVTSTPTATPTSGPPAPTGQTILTFGIPQTVKCEAPNQGTPLIHLSWTTANATGVTISIDGAGKYADYPATGSADVPFACGAAQHTYLITTHGTGSPATRTVVVRRTA